MAEDRREYWESLYRSRPATERSWHEPVPRRSLNLIGQTGMARAAPLIDVGGGASLLVDHLLDAGYTDLTVLDLSPAALDRARARLGDRAKRVTWIVADVTAFVASRRYALWHDRAVLHFLLEPGDREAYVTALRGALEPGGHVILATFGPGGPQECSGLPVQRYSVASLAALLGDGFRLLRNALHRHPTPGGAEQQFLYTLWQSVP